MATPTLKYVAPTVPEANLPLAPEPVEIYGLGGSVDPQAAPTIDDTPADAAAVAADLQAVVDALVAAGVFTA